MLRTCRRYLNWVQNSVFEGEISKANYEALVTEINKITKELLLQKISVLEKNVHWSDEVSGEVDSRKRRADLLDKTEKGRKEPEPSSETSSSNLTL